MEKNIVYLGYAIYKACFEHIDTTIMEQRSRHLHDFLRPCMGEYKICCPYDKGIVPYRTKLDTLSHPFSFDSLYSTSHILQRLNTMTV